MKYLKVEGHSNLVRDERTKAILNTNMSDYDSYIRLKRIKESEDKKIKTLEHDINNIKDDLQEIKNLLKNLSNGTK